MIRKHFIAITALLLCTAFLLTACGTDSDSDTEGGGTTVYTPSTVDVPSADTMFTDADVAESEYEESALVIINLANSDTVSADPAVVISGTDITVTKPGDYLFTGAFAGTVTVDVGDEEKVHLIFRSVTLSAQNFAALYIKSADKVFLTLESESKLSTAGGYVNRDDNNVDGTVFSKGSLTIKGGGNLTVNSAVGNGIVCKDDLRIMEGVLTVTAPNHAIDANDSVRIAGGTVSLNAGLDGVHAENADDLSLGFFYMEGGLLTVISGGDGIDASASIQITGGTLTVTTGGGSTHSVSSTVSSKGVKATGDLSLSGGSITVNSSDDAIHSNDSVFLAGVTLRLQSGDDGVHADTSLVISSGTVTVTKSYEGLEAQNITVSGGTVSVTTSDDGLNAAGGNDASSIGGRPGQNSFTGSASCFLQITGGDIYVNAGGDGLDANGSLLVSGGFTMVDGPTGSGNGPLDYDSIGTVTGGTVIAIGSSGMAMNFSSATQGSVLCNFSSTQKAGTAISLTDASGNTIVSCTAAKSYSSVLVTSPSIAKGNTYTLAAGTQSSRITLADYIYGSGSSMGGGMPGSRF